MSYDENEEGGGRIKETWRKSELQEDWKEGEVVSIGGGEEKIKMEVNNEGGVDRQGDEKYRMNEEIMRR